MKALVITLVVLPSIGAVLLLLLVAVHCWRQRIAAQRAAFLEGLKSVTDSVPGAAMFRPGDRVSLVRWGEERDAENHGWRVMREWEPAGRGRSYFLSHVLGGFTTADESEMVRARG